MSTEGTQATGAAMAQILDRMNVIDERHQERHECLRADLCVLKEQITETRLSVEHRLTKVEVRASLMGVVAGALAAVGINIIKP